MVKEFARRRRWGCTAKNCRDFWQTFVSFGRNLDHEDATIQTRRLTDLSSRCCQSLLPLQKPHISNACHQTSFTHIRPATSTKLQSDFSTFFLLIFARFFGLQTVPLPLPSGSPCPCFANLYGISFAHNHNPPLPI